MVPAGFAPFGIQAIGDTIYMTFAKQDKDAKDELHGHGLGAVDAFDLNGQLIGRVASGGPLNAPWGLALAPSGFGRFGGDLLVGNFGDGTIGAYRRSRDRWMFEGSLQDRSHRPIAISGLWSLAFGNDGLAGSSHTLFFTAGPHTWVGATEQSVHGLLGAIDPA